MTLDLIAGCKPFSISTDSPLPTRQPSYAFFGFAVNKRRVLANVSTHSAHILHRRFVYPDKLRHHFVAQAVACINVL